MTTLAEPPSTAEAPIGAPISPNRSTLPPMRRSGIVLFGVAVALLAGFLVSLWWIELNPFTLYQERQDIFNLLERMWPPRIEEPGLVWEAAIETFLMAFAGTAMGVILAVPIAILAASNITTFGPLRYLARGIIVLTRALPELILALIFVRVYSIGVLPGVVAIGLHSIGMLGKLFADSIEQINEGQREGVQATGAGRSQDFMTSVWPQVLPSFIAISLYRLDINFRASTLLGLVGAGGIGLQIRAHQGSLDYEQLLGVTLVIVALIVVVELVSTYVRSIILGHNRSKGSSLDKWFRRTPAVENFAPERSAEGTDSTQVRPADDNQRLRAPWNRDRIVMNTFWAVCVVLLVLLFIIPEMSFLEFVRGLPQIPVTFTRLVPRSLDWWNLDRGRELLETVAIGFGATGIGLFFALPTAAVAAGNLVPGWVALPVRMFVLLVRAVPELIVAVILVAGLGLGPRPGVLALAFGMYAFGTKLFADGLEEVADGPREGVRASGAGWLQEFTTAVMPQAMPGVVGNSLYILDGSLRASTVLGIVGAGGIGFALLQGMKLLRWELVGGLLLCVFIIVLAIEFLSDWIRRQIL